MTSWSPPFTLRPLPRAGRGNATSRTLAIPVEWLLSAHELAMGRPTVNLARYLFASQHHSTGGIAARQINSLRTLVELARSRSPYYRRLGLPPAEHLTDTSDLLQFPLLSRDTLAAHASDMCVDPPPNRRLRDHSSGSTGPAVAYYWDRMRQAWDKANRQRGHAWLGFTAGDRELHLWPVDIAHTRGARLREWMRIRRDAFVGDLLIDSNGDVPASAIWHRWRQFDPARITAFPSRICEVIQAARRQGCRLFSPSLRCMFLTGEVTHEWQRSLIERELGVATAQSYGVQEAGAIAFACEQGAWHTCAESIVVEFIRDGRPGRIGELAEVVVTSLVNRTMPLIRYRTGDLVRVAESAPCRCDRGLPTMPHIRGRFGDFLVSAAGEWIEPARVLARLGEVLQPGSFQVMQTQTERIEIHVVEGPQPRSDWRDAVVQRIAALAGPDVPVTIRRVPHLARCTSGKMRYVQSQLSLAFVASNPA